MLTKLQWQYVVLVLFVGLTVTPTMVPIPQETNMFSILDYMQRGRLLTGAFIGIQGGAQPAVSDLFLTSTAPTRNDTNQNLTASWVASDTDGDPIYNSTNWYKNGISITVLNLPFEQTDGTETDNAKDYSGFGNNLSETGNPTWRSSLGFDGYGAYDFDGVDDRITVSSLPQLSDDFSISYWVYRNGTQHEAFALTDNGQTNANSPFGWDNGQINIGNSTNYGDHTISLTAVLNAWTHIVFVVEGNRLLQYNNSELTDNISISPLPYPLDAREFRIGSGAFEPAYDEYFKGIIDNFLIYNFSLTPEQIETIYLNATDTVSSSLLVIGDSWNLSVTPNDGTQDGVTMYSNEIIIKAVNVLPNITTPSFFQNPLLNNTTLVANTSYVDQENALGTLHFEWYVDGGLVHNVSNTSQLSGTTINTSLHFNNYSRDNEINLTVYADDGADQSVHRDALIVVANAFPKVSSVEVTSTDAARNGTVENLSFSYLSADADGEELTNITTWFLNGSSIMVLNMPFGPNETHDNASDYSSYQNNATLVQALYNSTGGYDGFGAFEFNGSSQIVVADQDMLELNGTHGFTISAWFNMRDSCDSTTVCTIISKGNINTGAHAYLLGGYSPTDKIRWWVRGTGGSQTAITTLGFNRGEWNHVALRFNGTNVSLFLNGVEQKYGNDFTELAADELDLVIGKASYTDALYFNGTIDQVQVYNVSLSTAQINNLFYNSTDTMDSSDTSIGDNWSAQVTLFDDLTSSSTEESNNISIADVDPPLLTSLNPELNSEFNISDAITINATVTDDVSISQVAINLSDPLGIITAIDLESSGNNIYNTTFVVGSIIGIYNITFIANDSSGNQNATESTNFTVNDIHAPNVTQVVPEANTVYSIGQAVDIGATVLDNIAVTKVFANVSFANGSLVEYQLINGSSHDSIFNTSVTAPALLGDYNITLIANDSSNNVNDSLTTNFTVIDTAKPNVFNLVCAPNSPEIHTVITCNATITDDLIVASVQANVTMPNGTIEVQVVENTNEYYNFTFSRANGTGQHTITWFTLDSSGNNETNTSLFVVVDTKNPSVLSVTPALSTVFSVGDTIEINATVTDEHIVSTVMVNVRYPNGSLKDLDMVLHANEVYNTTLIAPALVGNYNLTYVANDSSNNINDSQMSNFTVNDTAAPSMSVLGCTPSSINISDFVHCNTTITDDVQVTTVLANVTYPNGTHVLQTVHNASDVYNFTFTDTVVIDQFTVTWFALDAGNNTQTNTTNFTVNDVTPPNVTLFYPAANSFFNVSNIVELAVNVSDEISVSQVFVNMSYPNGTVVEYELTNDATHPDSFNASFVAPPLVGNYNLTFIANDTSNNVNDSQASNLTVNDTNAPAFDSVHPQGTEHNFSNPVHINVTVTDDVQVLEVTANITFPNATHETYTLTHTGANSYNTTFISPHLDGNYTFILVAKDASNNENLTTSNFTVTDPDLDPVPVQISPADGTSIEPSNVTFICNVSDDLLLSNLSLYISNSTGHFVLNSSINVTGTSATANWSSTLSAAVYSWGCSASDNATQKVFTTNYTLFVGIDAQSTPAPSPSGGGGGGSCPQGFHLSDGRCTLQEKLSEHPQQLPPKVQESDKTKESETNSPSRAPSTENRSALVGHAFLFGNDGNFSFGTQSKIWTFFSLFFVSVLGILLSVRRIQYEVNIHELEDWAATMLQTHDEGQLAQLLVASQWTPQEWHRALTKAKAITLLEQTYGLTHDQRQHLWNYAKTRYLPQKIRLRNLVAQGWDKESVYKLIYGKELVHRKL